METCRVILLPSATRTRVLVLDGRDEILRAALPPPSAVTHERAATTLLEGLALWLNRALWVVLSVADEQTSSYLGLTDELGVGHRSLFFRVEVHERGRRRGARIRGIADFSDARQLWLDVLERRADR